MEAAWIADTNKFGLRKPPAWALKAIYDFDSQLVIVPSRTSKQYILCRRRVHSAGFGGLTITDPAPNTQMLYDHGLVDVAPLKWPGMWTESFVNRLLGELRQRDIWAAGGPDALVKLIEDAEADSEIRKKRTEREDFRHRAGDAWRSLQARRGARNLR